jgi:thiamine pyrophosphate-dependent acetolactate synthase large subunit-like protein
MRSADSYERFCNGLPGLATAFADRSPIVCITSSPPLRDAETNALQGFHDQVVLAKPITKFAHRLTTVLEIPRIVSLAWRTASSGAPGPVLLDFPIDVLFSPVEIERVAWGNITAPAVSLPGPDAGAIKNLASLLKGAERPVVIVGTGARNVRPPLPFLRYNSY